MAGRAVLGALIAVAGLLAGCASPAAGPVEIPVEGRAVLAGAVADAGLRPVPGATVEVVGTGLQTTADADARFMLAAPVGEHEVEITHPGFAPARHVVQVGPEGTRGIVLRFGTTGPGP